MHSALPGGTEVLLLHGRANGAESAAHTQSGLRTECVCAGVTLSRRERAGPNQPGSLLQSLPSHGASRTHTRCVRSEKWSVTCPESSGLTRSEGRRVGEESGAGGL